MPAYRGFPCCSCLLEWIPVYERAATARGIVPGPTVKILQLTGANPDSAGTHSDGGAFDFGFYSGDQARDLVWLGRQMGADATWYRAWDGNHHVHGVLRGCPHNGPARYQIDAVDDGYDGLGYMGREGPDDGPRPLTYRSWEQGIKWAEEEEDDMPTPEEVAGAVWGQKLIRGDTTLSAHQWATLAGARADQTVIDIDRLQARVDEVEKAIAGEVWGQKLIRGDTTHSAHQWMTLAGEAADEARNALEAAETAPATALVSESPPFAAVPFAALVGVLGMVLGAALTLALLAALGAT